MDNVVAIVDNALAKQGLSTKAVEKWKADMPTEAEMIPKDKYTIFDRKEKKYRKGIHSMFDYVCSVLVCGRLERERGQWRGLCMVGLVANLLT